MAYILCYLKIMVKDMVFLLLKETDSNNEKN